MTNKRVLLVILDGFGCRQEGRHNAIRAAVKPCWEGLMAQHPHVRIGASEQHVGLPVGQMGNSEVGHLNLGGGRRVQMDITRVDQALADGSFATVPAWHRLFAAAASGSGRLHVMGLLSDGGVHAMQEHLEAMVKLARSQGLEVWVHPFLDGRDTPPKSAVAYLERLDHLCRSSGAGIATVMGRFYAMDRDRRFERTEAAYRLLVAGEGARAADVHQALQQAYAAGVSDEFVPPTLLAEAGLLRSADAVVLMNFRADRARQLSQALFAADFSGFERHIWPPLALVMGLTQYDKNSAMPYAFAPVTVPDTLGQVISEQGLQQLRVAETEKYAHVTYFFNGGIEKPYAGEDRVMVPSPKVETYDLMPGMSAEKVTEKVLSAMAENNYHFIVVNYANGDMVGHTGNMAAATRAVEALDRALAQLVAQAQTSGFEVVITADHGNVETMFDESCGQEHTAHTLNPVPLVYIGNHRGQLREGGSLQDVAPTLLELMGIEVPQAMTGRSLWQ